MVTISVIWTDPLVVLFMIMNSAKQHQIKKWTTWQKCESCWSMLVQD